MALRSRSQGHHLLVPCTTTATHAGINLRMALRKPEPRSPFIGPLPHDEPVLSISESPGDAQDLRPDDSHHGRNTMPEEVDEVVRGGNLDKRQSDFEEVPPMHQDAEETISRRQFLREEDNVRPHLRKSKRTRKQTVHFKTDFGPASRWKDNNVATLWAFWKMMNGSRMKNLKNCGTLLQTKM